MRKEPIIAAQPRIAFLDEKGQAALHSAALRILQKTGVLVHHEKVVEMLASAGCRVSGKNIVHISADLLETSLRSCPRSVPIHSRKAEPALLLEGRRSYWGTGSDTPFIRDSFTDERRPTSIADVEAVSRLVDGLANMDFLMCMGIAHELSQNVADKHHFLKMVSNTTKPLVFTASSTENLRDIHEMACAVAGGEDRFRQKPFALHYTEPVAPLIHPRSSLEKLLYCVDHGIPVIYTSATTTAQNGPATLAGCMALSVARILSGIVIGQVRRPGAKMIVTMHASSMDPRSAIHTYASPEHVICQAVAKDMANYYHLPTFGRAGNTDSKVVDQQAAFEAGWEVLAQALSGENLIHDVGYLESGLTASWDLITMADEFIAAAKRVVRGFEINRETLALDLIDSVGPSGNFLAEEHTVEHFRRETWIPELLDRDNFQNWAAKGSPTLLGKVKARVKAILETHEPEPLDRGLLKELEKLAAKVNAG